MTEKDEKLVADFERKMRQLMFRCDSLKEENRLMKQQLDSKSNEINKLESQLKELEARYDNLKFAKSFSSNDVVERERAKNRLIKLVRDVDKCIAILKS